MEAQPGKPASKGPANWFTGDVWIDSITTGHAGEADQADNVLVRAIRHVGFGVRGRVR